jgi:hypothetical protein
MRKMIAVAAVLAMSSVHAEELKFGDVNYFFKQGQMNVLANVNSAFSEEKNDTTTQESRGYITETQFTYGFSDQLNAFIGLDYAYDLQTEISGNPDIDSDGLANPALGAIYRLMNQNDAAYNVDLGAVARINIEDAEEGSSDPGVVEDGNFANGRSSLELLARMGRKWNEANEWQLAGGLVYFKDGEHTVKDTTGDTDLEDDASMDLYLRASYQYRPINEIMFLLSAQATRVGEADSEVDGSNTKVEQDSHIDYNFGFTAKYLITENFIAKFNYGMSNNPDYDVKVGGTNEEVTKRRKNFWGLGVDFLF